MQPPIGDATSAPNLKEAEMADPQEGGAPRPLRRDAERNRQLILRAAAEVFTAKGLQASLDDVCTQLATDRGLHEIVMYATHGRDRTGRARSRMQPLVTALVQRAQQDGHVRADLRPTDRLFIEFMITAAARYAEPVKPEIWRRYLTLITDALRPARSGTTPLPEPALEPHEMAVVMRSIPQSAGPANRP